MKLWILTLPGQPAKAYGTEEAANLDIVKAAKAGLYGAVHLEQIETEDFREKPTPEPVADLRDYIIDEDGDRWDYFPAVNQYKLRRDAHSLSRGYNLMGFKSAAYINANHGIRYSSSYPHWSTRRRTT